ncbi:MAG: hydrogenase maturation protease [Deltaproteobacteria bacterium]|nr:hydrogenase maturation protease [Deltaproteobacteria bacterium]
MGKDTLVIGLGNILMGDDGAGIRVIEELSKLQVPANVELMDGGTPGVDLMSIIKKYKKVIIADAVLDTTPGASVRHFHADEITGFGGAMSLHGLGLEAAITLMKTFGEDLSGVTVVGIPIERAERTMELSVETLSRVKDAVEFITCEFNGGGHG